MNDAVWRELTEFSDAFTCYSSAVASWSACERPDWPALLDAGFTLTLLDAGDGLFGFAHLSPQLRAELGLRRTGVPAPGAEAVEGVLAELGRSGRVIVAGDGMRLPWHVAYGKRHVPHWYVLTGTPESLAVHDPFACRNELGSQAATRAPVVRERLETLLVGLPGDDPVFALRERLALGDDCALPQTGGCQWFVKAEPAECRAPQGVAGELALLELARSIRARAHDPHAYDQADDIWSIGRHRAFFVRRTAMLAARASDEALADWLTAHGEPLARRWSQMAPLLMQARLAVGAGRAPSGSVSDTLEELAERERAAAQAFPTAMTVGRI
jgi:hypothetical protein